MFLVYTKRQQDLPQHQMRPADPGAALTGDVVNGGKQIV